MDEGEEHFLNEVELKVKGGVTAENKGESEISVQERTVRAFAMTRTNAEKS